MPDWARAAQAQRATSTRRGLDWTLDQFNVRVNASRGEGKDEERRTLVNQFELTRALGNTNPATAFNPFGGPGSNNPATLASIFSDRALIGGTSQVSAYDADIDGPLFSLPGGQVRVGWRRISRGVARYGWRCGSGPPPVACDHADRRDRDTRRCTRALRSRLVARKCDTGVVVTLSLPCAGRTTSTWIDHNPKGASLRRYRARGSRQLCRRSVLPACRKRSAERWHLRRVRRARHWHRARGLT